MRIMTQDKQIEDIKYDWNGQPIVEYGKRRPNTPRSVTCQVCGEEALKVEYGTYECDKCNLVYQFRFGILVKGNRSIYTTTYKDKYRCSREKWNKSYTFPMDKIYLEECE